MFKLKPGNVFQKLNTMDRKKAYTIGAVVVVCFVALLTLASMMGDADDASFDGLNTRGYDLAQMPFVNDEAEQYLLAAKYPDMKENGASLLYSAQEKEERQEQDAEAAEENAEESSTEDTNTSDSDESYTPAPTSRGYSGRGGRTSTPTHVGQLGSAHMQTAQGSGVQGSWGAPRGDFSPYKSQNKGSEIPTQLKNQDARKALYQFARGSRAAAGLKEGKEGNAKKALMGGNIQGSEAFTDTGIDLSKASGLALDTNAPQESGDLSNLEKQVDETSRKASETAASETQKDYGEELLYLLAKGAIDALSQGLTKLACAGVDGLTNHWGWTDTLGKGVKNATSGSGSYSNNFSGLGGTSLSGKSNSGFGGFGGTSNSGFDGFGGTSNSGFGGFGESKSGFGGLGNSNGGFNSGSEVTLNLGATSTGAAQR